jgi:hypothetical protein
MKTKSKYGLTAIALAGMVTLTACINDAAYGNPSVSYANSNCVAQPDEANMYPTNEGTGIHVESYKGDYFIVGQTWITCNPQPASHHLEIDLYFQSFSQKTFQREPTRLQKYTSIPPAAKQFPFAVIFPCVPGRWQVRWSVVGQDGVGEPFTFSHNWTPITITALGCKSPQPVSPPAGGDGPVIV